MTTTSRIRAFELLLAFVSIVVCPDRVAAQDKVPTALNLGTIGTKTWSTDQPPTIAASASGVLYVLWPRPAQKKSEPPVGVPRIPGELAFDDYAETELGHVPAICVRREGAWSSPRLLIDGCKQCEPRYAWCEGETLNLLLTGPKGKCNHLRYAPDSDQWTRAAELDFAPRMDDGVCRIGVHLHFATAAGDSIAYMHFDGSSWSKPVMIDTGEGAPSVRCTRLTVVRDGTVQIIWWGSDKGKGAFGHAAVREGTATSSILKLEGTPIFKDTFDLGVDFEGRAFMAYRPEATGQADDAHILVRQLANGKWSNPAPIADKNNGLSGQVIVMGDESKVAVSWIARDQYRIGKGSIDRQVRRIAIGDGRTWQQPRSLAYSERPANMDGIPVAPDRIGWCLDKQGDLHVAWGNPEVSYCLAARLRREGR